MDGKFDLKDTRYRMNINVESYSRSRLQDLRSSRSHMRKKTDLPKNHERKVGSR